MYGKMHLINDYMIPSFPTLIFAACSQFSTAELFEVIVGPVIKPTE